MSTIHLREPGTRARFVVIGTVLTTAMLAWPATGAAQRQWNCAVDLQQGGTGQLALVMMPPTFRGTMTVQGNTSRVAGTWNGESITFRRTLGDGTVQPFRGVAIDSGDGKVKMAGRFAAGFDGIWSATCSTGEPPSPPTTPPSPPTTPPGPPPASNCSIAGSATGPRADVAGAFSVTLMGPNSDRTFRARLPLGNRSYRFTGLPDGKYLLFADTKADVAVRVIPPRQTVVCQGGAIEGINFDFR